MKFGDWIEVSAVLRRKREHKKPNTWERISCEPFKAIFLGTRTLWDSAYVNFGFDEVGLENTNPTKGAVVCQKNRKPVYVRVEDCVLILNPDMDKLVSGIADILSQYNDFI